MFRLIEFLFLAIYAVGICAESTKSNDTWSGKWFPQQPHMNQSTPSDLNELFNSDEDFKVPNESWRGKWFPRFPHKEFIASENDEILNEFLDCDDGRTNIGIDFDPSDSRHSHNYLCIDHKSKYDPSFATVPVLREHNIPPAYEAPSICLNETIKYEDSLPTFGPHRFLYPKYGQYKFLPAQRWLHNLEFGAIVMLFHPCADKMQVRKLKTTLNACLYRHVITPSTLLLPERPLALVAWGKSLEMSVVSVRTVVDFIKDNAKKGPGKIEKVHQAYDAGLVAEAKLVTDEQDSEVCANVNS